jgi:hypothetical protein
MTSSLQLGISAAKAGQMQEALEHLKDAIIEEPQNAEVWVWIAAIIDDMDKQAVFLEKALEIDPHNLPAQRGLAYLEKRKRDEASVANENLSDHTRPISPFPASSSLQSAPPVVHSSSQTVAELGALANQSTVNDSVEKRKPETIKLAPVEIGLLGVVTLVFCFIGLLAASALFNFDLPLGFLLGNRAALASDPPYAGVFLYENEMFFEIQRHTGLPTQDQGIPTSQNNIPLIIFWAEQAQTDQIKLVFQTGEYIPIQRDMGKNQVMLIQPRQELQPGLHCFQQLDEIESQEAFYWCFRIDFSTAEN